MRFKDNLSSPTTLRLKEQSTTARAIHPPGSDHGHGDRGDCDQDQDHGDDHDNFNRDQDHYHGGDCNFHDELSVFSKERDNGGVASSRPRTAKTLRGLFHPALSLQNERLSFQ